ncbi:hypothetical protein GCM10009836_73220 [Pseudonocardia ailaonensis]|uniref:Uncharacterized protein n=1 Tax=Pseudonocardia ailaonensis TaxID=367279 RepID=A0ABN2NQ37_9PSEU
MTEQVGRDHVGEATQEGQHGRPGGGAAGQAVQEDDGGVVRAVACLEEGDLLVVQGDQTMVHRGAVTGPRCRGRAAGQTREKRHVVLRVGHAGGSGVREKSHASTDAGGVRSRTAPPADRNTVGR